MLTNTVLQKQSSTGAKETKMLNYKCKTRAIQAFVPHCKFYYVIPTLKWSLCPFVRTSGFFLPPYMAMHPALPPLLQGGLCVGPKGPHRCDQMLQPFAGKKPPLWGLNFLICKICIIWSAVDCKTLRAYIRYKNLFQKLDLNIEQI